ncbi:MAG: hypothetical protein DCC59_10315 [Chloroflexi bacterium]|nr:SH3 domain-containing protein [Chloroflexi bacterium CFX1]MDL1919035.1 SH3 domain-containing protein [Chloroflexi bacterium CFX5]RIK52387.1 MAG: hypothetical protein DCC59_10315 [Chloroflexota bacterium]
MKNTALIWIALIVLLSGCDASPSTPDVVLPLFVTATLPPSAAPPSTRTASPPTAAPTIDPIPGTTTSEVNVRVEPSTASQSLGTIPPFSTVQVAGKESFGYWLRIVFDDGNGWVRADYVQVSGEVPLVDAGAGSGSGARGAILRGVNVRSGPGGDFDSLGLLNQRDIVFIMGKNSSGGWFHISYPPAPEGAGWVSADFVEIANAVAIPIFGDGTPLAETSESAPEKIAAPADGDTADAPLANFALSPASARAIQFDGEISAPDDLEDWLAFSSSQSEIAIQFLCKTGAAQVELTLSGLPPIGCGEAQSARVEPGVVQLLKITPASTGDWVRAQFEIRIAISN